MRKLCYLFLTLGIISIALGVYFHINLNLKSDDNQNIKNGDNQEIQPVASDNEKEILGYLENKYHEEFSVDGLVKNIV